MKNLIEITEHEFKKIIDVTRDIWVDQKVSYLGAEKTTYIKDNCTYIHTFDMDCCPKHHYYKEGN